MEEARFQNLPESQDPEQDVLSSLSSEESIKTVRVYQGVIVFLIVVILALLMGLLYALQANTSHQNGQFRKPTKWANSESEFGIVQMSDIHYLSYYNESCSCRSYCTCHNHSSWAYTDCSSTWVTEPAKNAAPYSRGTCDIGERLVNATLTKAKSIMSNFSTKYVLVTGDLLGHGLEGFMPLPSNIEQYIQEQYKYVLDQIVAMTSKTIFPTIGNNDPHGDYMPPTGTHLEFFGNLFESVLNRNSASYIRTNMTYLKSGLWYMIQPEKNFFFLGLNSLYFSRKVNASLNNFGQIAQTQLAWIEEQFQTIENEYKCPNATCSVVISGHIPPVLSMFSKNHEWDPSYQTQYEQIIGRTNLRLIHIFGHTHTNTMHKIGERLCMIAPSISPIFKYTNPTFRQYAVSQNSMEFVNFRDISLDLTLSNLYATPLWFEKNFREVMKYQGVLDLTDGGLTGVSVEKLMSDTWFKNPLSSSYVNGIWGDYVDPTKRVTFVLCYNQTTKAGLTACIARHDISDLGR